MLPHSLSAIWNIAAPAIADHLWQSTLFAAAAALLTLALRTNSARTRYFLWLSASLKFLVPFSLLVAVGSQFSWRHMASAPTAGIYFVEVATQPFTNQLPLTRPGIPVAATPAASTLWLPILLGVWLCGFLIVLFIWTSRWFRISGAIRKSVPLTEGREVSTLRRLERIAGMPNAMRILLSQASLEPGVFGILRPILLWPHSISEHLDEAQLEAVLAHELSHVRRRDNLAAVLHMLVEAVFWFHPLVWWIGARLMEERERACDEAVVELGSHRHIYAESILKVCEFCLSSPLTCVSGVTGADLKKRMVHIMTDRVVRKLNLARKLLLWTAACLAIALPIAFGLLNATPSRAADLSSTPKFSVVSISPHPSEPRGMGMTKMMLSPKDGGMIANNISPSMLIHTAYELQPAQLAGGPDWAKSEKYDIHASLDQSTTDELHKLNEPQRKIISQQMLRNMLADYFKLSLHQESREQPVYELVIADGGPKLHKTATVGMTRMSPGELDAKGAPLSLLTAQLSQRLGRTVLDKTGLTGNYDFTLKWTPDADEMAHLHAELGGHGPVPGEPATSASGPNLTTAVQEQLGLKLQPATERVPVLVIDHIEQPAAN